MDKDFTCPHCGKLNDVNRGLYCTDCGKLLLNSCTNSDCENSDPWSCDNMSDERYCPLCGTVTTFELNGLVVD